MKDFKLLFTLIILAALINCGKDKEIKNHRLERNTKPDNGQKTSQKPEFLTNDTIYPAPKDSIHALKYSTARNLKKETRRKKKQQTTNESIQNTINNNKATAKTPSFLYIKKILNDCKVGVTMTQKDLAENLKIPKEGIKIVKSVTKISDTELDIKWKSTWLIEKISDAKFKDGRLKVCFDKNRIYTSGGAIGIKYEKKMYTDLYLIGHSAYIPTVKGYYWEIGKD